MERAKIKKSDRGVVVKFFGAADGIGDTAQLDTGEGYANVGVHGELQAPYDPGSLAMIVENSNSLKQNIVSYEVNIDGTGYAIQPVVKFDTPAGFEVVRDALYAKRLDEWLTQDPSRATEPPESPSDEEVEGELQAVSARAKREKLLAESFFASACPGASFTTLRRQTRVDLETTGNAYWEIIRDGLNRVRRIKAAPTTKMRLAKFAKGQVEVKAWSFVSVLEREEYSLKRRFRRFIQIGDHGEVTWFKEMGDPRVISRVTGEMFKDMAAFKKAKRENNVADHDEPGTEILHFRRYAVGEHYGLPLWAGVMLEALGSRAASEVNYMFFDNKGIPPLLVTVSGGNLKESSVKKIQDMIVNQMKGRKGFSSAVLIEAQGQTARGVDKNPGIPTIEIHKLFDAFQHDALFQEYDKNNIEKIGAAFRLPPLLRGIIKDVNRASAYASLQFAEDQVFAPERYLFDEVVNYNFGPEIGMELVRFKSNGIVATDPEVIDKLLKTGTATGAVMPNEAREKLGGVLGVDLPAIDEWWMNQPVEVTKLGIIPEDAYGEVQEPASEEDRDDDDAGAAKVEELMRLTKEVRENGAAALTEAFKKNAVRAGLHVEELAPDEFAELVDKT